jgi:hypothetical protein
MNLETQTLAERQVEEAGDWRYFMFERRVFESGDDDAPSLCLEQLAKTNMNAA